MRMAWWTRRKEVNSNINKIFDPLGLRAPTTIKYESLLQKLIKAGLEWVEPLQGKLDKEAGAVRQEMELMKRVLKYHQTGGLPEEQTLPGSKPFTATCLDFMNCEGVGEQECRDEGLPSPNSVPGHRGSAHSSSPRLQHKCVHVPVEQLRGNPGQTYHGCEQPMKSADLLQKLHQGLLAQLGAGARSRSQKQDRLGVRPRRLSVENQTR